METVMRPEPLDGLAAAKARSRRLQLIIGGLMGAGAVLGFFSAIFEMDGGGFMQGIPAAWAIAASVILLGALGFGGWRYKPPTHDPHRGGKPRAGGGGRHFSIGGYASWYLWWRGGLVPEPQHQAIFIATMAAMMLAYGYKKLRP